MKQGRQERILELIKDNEISTQEELLELLKKSGFDITQATISRDIKELRLIKTLSKNGEYIYSTAGTGTGGDLALKFEELFSSSVLKVDYAVNQVVVKCHSGLANAVCESMDRMRLENVVGTIAGDNTILVIMRNEQEALTMYQQLMKKLYKTV